MKKTIEKKTLVGYLFLQVKQAQSNIGPTMETARGLVIQSAIEYPISLEQETNCRTTLSSIPHKT